MKYGIKNAPEKSKNKVLIILFNIQSYHVFPGDKLMVFLNTELWYVKRDKTRTGFEWRVTHVETSSARECLIAYYCGLTMLRSAVGKTHDLRSDL